MEEIKVWQEGQSDDKKSLTLYGEEEITNRFVAFLDIMGFKDRVARTKHNVLLSQLEKFNRDITQYIGIYEHMGLQLAQFSDSIVLFSNDDTLKSLEAIGEVASGVMRIAIQQQIPLKGAIAQGQITCDISKQLFFGQALIDAYLLEESIHYYGVLVHHSAEQSVIDLNKTSRLFKDVKAPLKSGKISHYELSWYVNNGLPDRTEQLAQIRKALNHIRQTVSDAPRKYIDHTLEVMKDYEPA